MEIALSTKEPQPDIQIKPKHKPERKHMNTKNDNNWVVVKRKRKFDPVKASAPMLLETLMEIVVLASEKSDCRADIIAKGSAAIRKVTGI